VLRVFGALEHVAEVGNDVVGVVGWRLPAGALPGMVASAISAPASSTAIQGEGYKSLAEGAQVDYEPQQGEKGPQAANVTLVA